MKIKSDNPSEGFVVIKNTIKRFCKMIPSSLIFKLTVVAIIIVISSFVWDYSGPLSLWLCAIAFPVVFSSDLFDKVFAMVASCGVIAVMCTADIYEKKYENIPIKIDKIDFIDSTEKVVIHSSISDDVIIVTPNATTYYNIKEHQNSLKMYLQHIGKFDYYDKQSGSISTHDYHVFADYGKGEIRISDKSSPYASEPTEVFKNLK